MGERADKVLAAARENIYGPQQRAVAEAQQIHQELSTVGPNTEIDTKEFAEHFRAGGWRLGLLVVRNVEAGIFQSGRSLPVTGLPGAGAKKISYGAFARLAGCSHKSVTKYLRAWDAAAEAGLVPPSSDLQPGQSFEFGSEHTPKRWRPFFKGAQKKPNPSVLNRARCANKALEDVAAMLSPEAFLADFADYRPQDVLDTLTAARSTVDRAIDKCVKAAVQAGCRVVDRD